MDLHAREALERGDPLLAAMDRLVRLASRVNRLEGKLERLRRRERAVFRAFHSRCLAEDALAIWNDRRGRG